MSILKLVVLCVITDSSGPAVGPVSMSQIRGTPWCVEHTGFHPDFDPKSHTVWMLQNFIGVIGVETETLCNFDK